MYCIIEVSRPSLLEYSRTSIIWTSIIQTLEYLNFGAKQKVQVKV